MSVSGNYPCFRLSPRRIGILTVTPWSWLLGPLVLRGTTSLVVQLSRTCVRAEEATYSVQLYAHFTFTCKYILMLLN